MRGGLPLSSVLDARVRDWPVMIRRSIDAVVGAICLACIGYVYFFVPVGQRTLFEHTMRIAATQPAQELGRDATTTAHALGARVIGEVDRLTTDGGVPDPRHRPTVERH